MNNIVLDVGSVPYNKLPIYYKRVIIKKIDNIVLEDDLISVKDNGLQIHLKRVYLCVDRNISTLPIL